MLGRLLSAQNPESGVTNYGYDDNGNLTSRVMADGAALGIEYDNLNRPWRKTYSGPRSTPQVTLCYDGELYSAATSDCAPAGPIANANTRLTEVRTSDSSTKYTGYHERGFVTGLEQKTDGSGPYVFSDFTYNLAGVLTGITYPSGRRLTYGVDAAGLVDSISGQAVTYGSIAYAAHGVPNSITFGNGLVETWQHSSTRLQPEWVKLGTTEQPESIGRVRIAYCPAGFGASCATNNGNVVSEGIKIGGSEVARGYRYDAFNRLALSVEDGNANEQSCTSAGGRRCEHFGYDVFGNRRILDRGTDLTASLSEPTAFDGNNRATGGSWQYDAAGNLDQDGAGMSMTYDGEGRVKTAGTWEYVYDGQGRRVLKRNGAGSRTVYVYGPDGELAAEYSTDAPQVSGVQYVSVDWLGSTRIVTGPAGEVQQRTDYLPFGAVVGFDASDPRSGQAGYGNDVIAQKFTGKERDAETGLDYFGARYFSGAQGRFTSPDPMLNSGRPWLPQSWNRYAYALNNPLKFTDPTGLYEWGACSGTDKECESYKKNFRDSLSYLKTARDSFDKKSREYKRLDAALKAYGKEGEKNGVSVGFGALDNDAAARTTPSADNTAFSVVFDPAKMSATDRSKMLAVDVGHEGTHVDDFRQMAAGASLLSGFAQEYRGYETSAFVFQGLFTPPLTANQGNIMGGTVSRTLGYAGFTIWNTSWAAADKATLQSRDTAITNAVKARYPHEETQPHNPWGN